jgi:hypothetical protein
MPGFNAMRYAKFGVALLIPLLIAANTVLNGGTTSTKEIEDIAVGLVGALAVFAVPNAPAAVPVQAQVPHA